MRIVFIDGGCHKFETQSMFDPDTGFLRGDRKKEGAPKFFDVNEGDVHIRDVEFHLFECMSEVWPVIESHMTALHEKWGAKFTLHRKALFTSTESQNFYRDVRQEKVGSTLMADKQYDTAPGGANNIDFEHPEAVGCEDAALFLDQFWDGDYLILKLDVEGAEYDIIEHLLETGSINKLNEIHVEWHDQMFRPIRTPQRESLVERIKQTATVYKRWLY